MSAAMKAMSVAEDVESVAESVVESVAESVERSPAEALLAGIALMEEQLKQLKKDAKAALKGKLVKRTKKDPAAPKAERPAQTSVWSDFVAATQLLMESEGWPAFVSKKGVSFTGSEETEEGGHVFADNKKKPVYKDAMAYAGYRKEQGEYVDPGADAREAAKAEKTAQKEKEKADKATQREAAKKEKEEKKAEEKRIKDEAKAAAAALKAAEKAAKEAEKAAKTSSKPAAVKAAAAKPATKAAGGAGTAATKVAAAEPAAAGGAKASPPAAEKPEPKAAPAKAAPAKAAPAKPAPAAAAKPAAEDEDEEIPKLWDFKGVKYFKNGLNQVWEMKNKKPGKWVGVYNPTSNAIEASEEPEFEFDE